MLIDIPAVASMAGSLETITWNKTGVYTAGGAISNEERFFVYVDPPDSAPYAMRVGNGKFTISGTTVTLRKNPPYGSVIKFLTCAAAAFQVPPWCSSWSMKNISGADMYFRRYSPNVLANVIDVAPATLADDIVVGMQLDDGATVSFSSGSFTPGVSYAICASAAVTDGCIVNFNP
jgi:hypothetical protein